MSTMKDIATNPAAAYHRWLELGKTLQQAADARLFPALTVEHVEGEDYLRCPHCADRCEQVAAHDVSHRVTSSGDDGVEYATREVSFYYDGGHFEGFVYLSTCCNEPVSLPAGWVEV